MHHDVRTPGTMGLCSASERNVLSTLTPGAVRMRTILYTPAISVRIISGFEGVSICTSFVVGRIAFSILAGLTARAEVKVTFDRNTEGTPEFKFKNVPSPVKNDAAAKGKFTIVDGQSDSNGSNLRALNNGRLPQEEDDPGANFFFQAGTEGGRLKLDLGSVIDVKQINSYSWHPSDRAPQVYKLYAADGTAAGL